MMFNPSLITHRLGAQKKTIVVSAMIIVMGLVTIWAWRNKGPTPGVSTPPPAVAILYFNPSTINNLKMGEQVTVKAMLDPQQVPVETVNLEIQYNPYLLELTEIIPGQAFPYLVRQESESVDILRIVAAAYAPDTKLEPLTQTVEVCDLNFKVVGSLDTKDKAGGSEGQTLVEYTNQSLVASQGYNILKETKPLITGD